MADETEDQVLEAAAPSEEQTAEPVQDAGAEEPVHDDSAAAEALEQVAADVRLSGTLAEMADAWIDLQRPATEGEYLMENLARRYEELLGSFLGAAQAGPEAQHTVMKLLVKQLARAQADIFALKAAVLGRDKLVLTRDWEYRDPLQAYYDALGETATTAHPRNFSRYNLPLDSSIMGFGWYATEESGGNYWRWSGPGLASGLMVPRLFEGPVRMEARIKMLNRSVMPESGLVSINGRAMDYSLTFDDHDAAFATVGFDLDLGEDRSPFFMLEFKLAGTTSPKEEFGSADTRQLGVCLLRLEIVPKQLG